MDYYMRAKEAKQNFFEGHQDDMLDFDTLQMNGSPYAVIDGDPTNLGTVIDVSMGLLRLFGYDK